MSEEISKAQELAFDISRQFMTFAVAGIGFAIAVTGEHPDAYSAKSFAVGIGLFVLGVVAGLAFLMHGVSKFSEKMPLDVYSALPRWLSLIQIFSVAGGASLILYLHLSTLTSPAPPPEVIVDITVGGKKSSVLAPAGSKVEAAVSLDGTVVFTVR